MITIFVPKSTARANREYKCRQRPYNCMKRSRSIKIFHLTNCHCSLILIAWLINPTWPIKVVCSILVQSIPGSNQHETNQRVKNEPRHYLVYPSVIWSTGYIFRHNLTILSQSTSVLQFWIYFVNCGFWTEQCICCEHSPTPKRIKIKN